VGRAGRTGGVRPGRCAPSIGPASTHRIIGHAIFLDHHSWLHWPTRDDLPRLAATGTNVAHCPTVFSRRGITLEHFGAYRAAGVNLGVGTDTLPHNLIARIAAENARAVTTADIFTAATRAARQTGKPYRGGGNGP
jgi:5-methylthioadenosine/S-adenosylhomocysteine deaminase